MNKIPRRILIGLGIVLLGLTLLGIVAWELLSSALEARYLADLGQKMTWRVEPGPSKRIHFPGNGPYDVRMGYSKLPDYTERLTENGWHIAEQAKISVQMARVAELGLFLPYREKDQGGIQLLDAGGESLYRYRYPERIYTRFEEVPPVVARVLSYIENRELLSEDFPTRNPAVEWDRLGLAVLEKGVSLIDRNRNVPGGSTLPTQIEKYRHSPEGRTQNMRDKLRQMASASLKAYLDGTDTRQARRRTLLAYLNTVPLAAAPRFGEVHGVGDGLWAWYGLDFSHVNRVLARTPHDHDREYAAALKHVLSLIVAERRPSYYLAANRKALDAYTDDHLDMLAAAGLISRGLAATAKSIRLRDLGERIDPPAPRFVDLKAANALRIRIATLLGEARLYDLDRLDLVAHTTLNAAAQKIVSTYLQRLATPEAVAASGLYGKRLLKPDNDLGKIIYSFTLYEKSPQGMLLRVQADNLNQPFDLNQQARLDLGSTAKLRTLVTYLDIIARLHAEFSALDREQLVAQAQPQRDVLAQWVAGYLLQAADTSLAATLEAAMARKYSAAPEPFFTGGGVHTFANFDEKDNGRVMDLWQATQNSVNLVYIRLMRDVVRHYASRAPGAAARILEDVGNPARKTYLLRFVDKEGRVFLARFYQAHKGQTPEAMAEDLYARTRLNPRRFTAVYRYLEPQAGFDEYLAALKAHIPAAASLSETTLAALFKAHAPDAYNLADRGYVAQIHPLELWLVRFLRENPHADLKAAIDASGAERVEVYDWLFKTTRKNAQDIRIQSLLEVEAFDALLADWKKLGYPFDNLTPSYATAIGSSGDRPAALAELMGILVNDGVRLPMVSVTGLHFARDTPYETRFAPDPPRGERLLPAEVTRIVRRALGLVVDGGTAGRLKGTLKDANGVPIPIGGKTGTGDHRFEHYDRAGRLIESRVVNRTGTFVFYLGDRYFGTLTALVPGPQAAQYEYTSALTAQILKTLLPQLKPVLFPATTPPPVPPAEAGSPAEPVPVARPEKPVEKPEGPTSQGDPGSQEPTLPESGFPDALEPDVVVPAPQPGGASAAPGTASPPAQPQSAAPPPTPAAAQPTAPPQPPAPQPQRAPIPVQPRPRVQFPFPFIIVPNMQPVPAAVAPPANGAQPAPAAAPDTATRAPGPGTNVP
jgi:membrane peptidoglycan carboxypeptidase